MNNDRLVTFLYILLRDHVPAGTVESILRVERVRNGNKHLEAIAQEIAERLAERPEQAETFVHWGKKVINGERFLDLHMEPRKVPPAEKP